jgi:hypothetical protein
MEECDCKQKNGEGNVGEGQHRGLTGRTEFQVDGFEGGDACKIHA